MKLKLFFFISLLLISTDCFSKKAEAEKKISQSNDEEKIFFSDENLILPPILFSKKENLVEAGNRSSADKDFLMNFSRKD